MYFMNQYMLPSPCDISLKVVLDAYPKIFLHLMLMRPKLTTALNKKFILGNSKRVFWSVHSSGRSVDQNKVQISVTKEEFNSNRLNLHARKETEELCKMQLADANPKSVDVVTSFDLKPYRKPYVKKECVIEQLEAILNLFSSFFDFAYLQLLGLAFIELLPMYEPQSNLEQFCKELLQEIQKYVMGLYIKDLVPISLKSNDLAPIDFQSKAKTVELYENSVKPVGKQISSSSIKAETQVSVNLPEKISAKPVHSCCACFEPIWKKKFFDERRFGILEKCKCVICYGCLRAKTRATDRVVKGPVKCPICNLRSDNVASSSNWIKDEDKEQFFKEYCKNVQNTGIKMRLGWTSFPSRKDNLWTRAL